MADKSITDKPYYVYILFREDGVTPFYVGKGKGGRWLIHEKEAPRRTSHKDRIIQSMLIAGVTEIPKRKIATGLSDDEAKALEIRLIAEIGRYPDGPLANLTDGGDGVANLSAESRAAKSAANVASWKRADVRQKRLEGLISAWTPEKRAEHIQRSKDRVSRPEVRAKLIAGLRSPSAIEKKRISIHSFWSDPQKREVRIRAFMALAKDPVVIEKKRLAATRRRHTQETKEKIRQSSQASWADESRRAKMIEAIVSAKKSPEAVQHARQNMLSPSLRAKLDAGNARPEVRERRIAAQRAAFSTPEAKARRSAVSKAVWALRKAAKVVLSATGASEDVQYLSPPGKVTESN